MLRTMLSQPRRADRPLWEASISSTGLWPALRFSLNKIYYLGLSQQSRWARLCPRFTAPLKVLLRCICILGVKSKGYAYGVPLGNACPWRRQRPARVEAPPGSLWSCRRCVPVRPDYCWLLGKRCFDTLGMVCRKASVLWVFSKKVQVFPAYWNICFDFYNTVRKS